MIFKTSTAISRTAIGTPTPIPTLAPVGRPLELGVKEAIGTAGEVEEVEEETGEFVIMELVELEVELEVELMLEVLEVGIWFGIIWPKPSAQQALSKHQVPSSHNTIGTSTAKTLRLATLSARMAVHASPTTWSKVEVKMDTLWTCPCVVCTTLSPILPIAQVLTQAILNKSVLYSHSLDGSDIQKGSDPKWHSTCSHLQLRCMGSSFPGLTQHFYQ